MVDVYRKARSEAGYNATLFLRMVTDHGGLAAARQLLHAPAVSQGFTALWERGRLDLTMEALVLREPFPVLFTEDELETARQRLKAYGHEVWERPDAGKRNSSHLRQGEPRD